MEPYKTKFIFEFGDRTFEFFQTLPQKVWKINFTQCFSTLDPPLTENENFDMLKTCINGVFGLPTLDMVEKAKDEEVLEPQEREVRMKLG